MKATRLTPPVTVGKWHSATGSNRFWLGHPPGATGAKLITADPRAGERGKRYGLQTMCEGGGLANVTIVERL